jgi:hypothetical protein
MQFCNKKRTRTLRKMMFLILLELILFARNAILQSRRGILLPITSDVLATCFGIVPTS